MHEKYHYKKQKFNGGSIVKKIASKILVEKIKFTTQYIFSPPKMDAASMKFLCYINHPLWNYKLIDNTMVVYELHDIHQPTQLENMHVNDYVFF